MKFAFIQGQAAHFPVALLCQVFGVSRSGYYAWRTREPSARTMRQAKLVAQIRAEHEASRASYGSPRIQEALVAQGTKCSVNTIAKLMREHGIRSKMARKFRVATTDSAHPHPIAANVLNQEFTRERINEVWVADITYIPTREGWLYLAAVLDLCSRKVVGWATADHLRAELACRALQNALDVRQPSGPLLHHSDRGVQYACDDYQSLLRLNGLTPSMSRTGNCYDNAVMESFFGSLKMELVHHETYATRAQAHQSLFEYLEVFYNRQRLHSSLRYQSPHQFELTLP